MDYISRKNNVAKSIQASSQPNLKDWIVLLILSLIWGSSFILIKKSLIAMDPIQMGAMRISISSLAFLPVLLYHRSKIRKDVLLPIALVGIVGSCIPAFCFAYAQTYLSSTTTGLLNSLTPIFAFIIGVMFFNSKFEKSKLIGLLIGIVGASLLVLRGESDFGNNLYFALFIVLATACYGTSVNIIKSYLNDTNPYIVSSLSFFIIGIPCSFYIVLSGSLVEIIAQPNAILSLGAVSILSIFGTALATVFYFSLVQRTSPVFASSVAYLMPIVAMIWGVLDGEILGLLHLGSFALILIGIYLIRK